MIGAPVSASAARRKSGEPTSMSVRELVAERALAAVAQAVGGVPAERRGAGERRASRYAPARLPAGSRRSQARRADRIAVEAVHHPTTTSNAPGSTVERGARASTHLAVDVEAGAPSVSTSISRARGARGRRAGPRRAPARSP